MSKLNLKELRDARAAVLRQGEQLVASYSNADRDPTDEEMQTMQSLTERRKELDAQIIKAEEVADMARDFHIVRDDVRITGGKPRIADDPKRGFSHMGEFCKAVYSASQVGNIIDERLKIGAAPTSYGNEGTGADGGFAVPTDFSSTIMADSLEQDALLPLTDNDTVAGNGMTFPADETTPWGSNGVRAYWEAEASQATQTKPVLKQKTLRLKKLFALVPVTEELLADAGAMGSYVERKSAESIRYKTNDAIVNGTGAGTPLGIMAAPATVSQAKEGSQTAATINATNVAKMFGRVIGATNATWLINPDAYHQLPLMTIGDMPVWLPPSGLSSAPGGLLFGRPVVMSDTCATLGTVGDIILGNFAGYKTITKSAGVQTAVSMHLWFDYDVSAFRATFRVDGQPWLDTAYSPAKGAVTRSHFCTLATRA